MILKTEVINMQTSFDFSDKSKEYRPIHSRNELGIFLEFEEVVIPGSPTVEILLSSDSGNWYCGIHVMLENQGAAFNPRIMAQSYSSRTEALMAGVKHVSRVCTSAGTKRAKEVLELLKLVR